MMGSGGRGVSIYPATLQHSPCRFRTLNEITSPIVPTGTTRLPRLRGKLKRSGSSGARLSCCLLAPAESGAIGPYAMQDDRQLACHRDPRTRHAPTLGNVHAPRPQC
jgi:hypothetical protein